MEKLAVEDKKSSPEQVPSVEKDKAKATTDINVSKNEKSDAKPTGVKVPRKGKNLRKERQKKETRREPESAAKKLPPTGKEEEKIPKPVDKKEDDEWEDEDDDPHGVKITELLSELSLADPAPIPEVVIPTQYPLKPQ